MNTLTAGASRDLKKAQRQLRSYTDEALTRLRAQAALSALAVVLTVSFWLAVLLVFADRYFSLKQLGVNIYVIWAGVSAMGIPYILWRAYSSRIHEHMAAILTDERLKLNARLCSALTLDFDDPGNVLFADAFMDEALGKMYGLQVHKAFPVRASKAFIFLVIPAAAAAALYFLMPYQDALGIVTARENKRKADEERERTAKVMEGKLEDLKKKIDERGSEDGGQFKVSQMLKKADDAAKDLQDGKQNAEETLAKLGAVKKEIEDEKDKLTQGKEFLDRLEKLKAADLNLEESSLTKEVSNALKMGDPNLAAQEMRKLANKIKKDILDNPDKTDAQKKQELEKLQREVEKLAGALAEDEALRDHLQEISKTSKNAAQYQSLENEIKKQEARQNKGNKNFGDQLENQMEQTADELERLQEDNDAKLDEKDKKEMESLTEADEGIDDAVENLTGEKSEQGKPDQENGQPGGKKGKAGTKPGQKSGSSKGMRAVKSRGKMGGQPGKDGQEGGAQAGGNKNGAQGNKPGGDMAGDGLGGGKGEGHRPYRDGDAEFEKQKVKGKMREGAITGLSHFRGQGAKGDAPTEFTSALESAEKDPSSSLELDRVPADARDMVKDYFSAVHDGAKVPGAPEKPAPAAPKTAPLKE